MNDLPVPPDAPRGKWGEAVSAVLDGKVIYVPNLRPEQVSGNLSRNWMHDQGFRIRTVLRDGGTIAWIARRTK